MTESAKKKKVIFCVPTLSKPFQPCLDSLAASIPLIQAAGWDEGMANSIGCPYISRARETMLRKAMVAQADVIVFIDHDMSWEPSDLLRLIETEGEVVSGAYRFKKEPEEYMGALLPDIHGRPQTRPDGCVLAHCIPAGFLKITRLAVHHFMVTYPELLYLDSGELTVDLFNHGVHNHVWYGEDYAFSRNWNAAGGQIWVIPDLNLTHNAMVVNDDKTISYVPYPGNYHRFLLRQPGGSDSAVPDDPRLKVAA